MNAMPKMHSDWSKITLLFLTANSMPNSKLFYETRSWIQMILTASFTSSDEIER